MNNNPFYLQSITFIVTVVYAILTLVILIGGCLLTSPEVFGQRFANHPPEDNPARFILFSFNTLVFLVCVVYIAQLSHAMRVTRRFQRSVTANLQYGHEGGSSYHGSSEKRSTSSSSSRGENSENITSDDNNYNSYRSGSERGTSSSPPQFKEAINSVYRLFAINLLKVVVVGLSELCFLTPTLWPYQGYALGLASVSLSTDLKSNVIGIYLPKSKDSSTVGSTGTGNGNTQLANAGGVDSYQVGVGFSQSFGDLKTVAEEDDEAVSMGPQMKLSI
jgi:hypothetical protein